MHTPCALYRHFPSHFADTTEAANKLHAYFGEGVDVEGRSIGRAGKLQRRNPSCPRNIVHLVVALVGQRVHFNPIPTRAQRTSRCKCSRPVATLSGVSLAKEGSA